MNERYPFGTFRTLKMPAWQIAVIGALAAALVVSLAIFSFAVFLFAFPAILAIDWFYRWRRGKARPGAPQPAPRETVITTDYEVLPPDPANEERR